MSETAEPADEVLQAVSAAVLAVTRHLSVAEVFQVIVRSARRLLGARYAALGIPDGSEGFAEFVADGVSDKQREAIGPLPRQHGMLAALLLEGEPIRVGDIQSDPRFGWWPQAHPMMADFLGVPIRDGEEVVGIIFLANKADKAGFTARDEQLLTLFASHAAIAMANARLYERSRELTVAEERTRLARELHDSVAQKLFSLRLTARTAATLLDRDLERARTELGKVESLAAEAATELRSVIVELRPAELDTSGLAETIRKHLVVVGRLHKVRTGFETVGEVKLEGAAEVEVLRMIQEAVYNALRHARADLIEVSLRAGDEVVAEVCDDGVGFDSKAAATRGMGLASMRERAMALGGGIDVVTGPGRGTTVRIAVPHE